MRERLDAGGIHDPRYRMVTVDEVARLARRGRILINRYQGAAPAASTKVPVGPSGPIVAIRMMISAPSSSATRSPLTASRAPT